MLAFALDRVLGIEFDLTAHAEAFFDATACYFPITFRPPPDDPVGISPDDLRVALL
jgi:DNA repair/transcription protein MET18/MMS19